MPIAGYGVLKGKVERYKPGTERFTHCQIILSDPNQDEEFQVDVNVRSKDGSQVLYDVSDPFRHKCTKILPTKVDYGFTPLKSVPGSLAIDYLRGNLFDYQNMKPLVMDSPEEDDLNELLAQYLDKAQQDSEAIIYAFGQSFDDSSKRPRHPYSHIMALPLRGLHDVHMNQGNFGPWEGDNGPYQDGALFINFPKENLWVALFFAFQVQSFQTDEKGNPTGDSWADLHGGKIFQIPEEDSKD